MLKKLLITFFILTLISTIYSNIVYYSNYSSNSTVQNNISTQNSSYFLSNSNNLFWPIPGFYNITSPFGNRISPITKKLSTHSGIDIGALEGSLIYSACDGIVSFVGFNGANGYSIHISSNNLEFIYGHVSPNYIVSLRSKSKKWRNYSEWLDQNTFLLQKIILTKTQLANQQMVPLLVHTYILE